MKILDNISFDIDADAIASQAHIEPGSDDEKEFSELVVLAKQRGRPKAAYNVCFITQRDGDRVRVEDTWFDSRMLAHNLKSAERVFPMIATCGHEMDEAFPASGDMLKEFWWDLIKLRILAVARTFLNKEVHERFRLGKTSSMSPGSGDAHIWPIEQQRQLFSLFDNVEGNLGIKLTDSCLMIPNKTVSSILFPTEKDFRSCEVCHRENCDGRTAPFNKALWEEIQHD